MATRDKRTSRASSCYSRPNTVTPAAFESIYPASAFRRTSAARASSNNLADQPESILESRCPHDLSFPASPTVLADSLYAGSVSEASEYDFWATTTATVSPVSSAATSPGGEPFEVEPYSTTGEACYRLREPVECRLASGEADSQVAHRNSISDSTAAPSPVSFIHVTASDFSGGSGPAAPSRRRQDVQPPSPTRKRVRTRPTVEERIAAGRIPRPPNSFILYRSAQYRRSSEVDATKGDKLAQADLSRLIARMWREESPSVKEAYVRQAAEGKERHAQRFPDYVYRPVMPPRRKPAKKKESTSCVPPTQPDAPAAVTSSDASLTGFPASPVLVNTTLDLDARSTSMPEGPPASPRRWRLFRSGASSDPDPPLSCSPYQPAAKSWPCVPQPSPERPSLLAQYPEDVLPVAPVIAPLEPSCDPAYEPDIFLSLDDMLVNGQVLGSGALTVGPLKIDPSPDYERSVENALQLSGLRDFAGHAI